MSVSFKCGMVWVCHEVEDCAADRSLEQSPTECVGVFESNQMHA
jgi:hypothetical protein